MHEHRDGRAHSGPHEVLPWRAAVKEYTKKTTYVYPDGTKPPELDNISLKSDCVQEKSKVSKKFTPIGNDELDALIDSKDPFDLSRLDTDSHTHIYNLDDEKRRCKRGPKKFSLWARALGF